MCHTMKPTRVIYSTGRTSTTDALRTSVTCSCTDMPYDAATLSGTETAFETETALDVMLEQIGSEKVA